MKKLVVATTNNNKVERIKKLLKNLDYEIISLREYDNLNIGEPKETADTPTGIAIEKALYYANKLPEKTLILTQDDTLHFENIRKEDNPGLSIKEPVRKKYGYFTDEYAAEYYKSLAKKYGGTIPVSFRYGHAIAIKKEGERTVTKVIGANSKLEVRLVDKIYKLETVPGYFLSALMEAKVNGEWKKYNDLDEETLVKLDNDLYKSIKTLLENI